MLSDTRHVHLIGIGGIGVSAVARILLARGFAVSGSDVRESQLTSALRDEGATVTIGHRAENLDGADLVVWSTAVPETNPELVEARRRGMPVRHRAEVLGALLSGYRSVGVIGTHGKGTVSAMITRVLDAAGRDPSFIIGGLLLDYGTNARARRDSPDLVVEIDESDGSLVHVRPEVLTVNNLEADHLNYYKDLDAVYEVVAGVLSHDDGRHVAVVHLGDPGVRAVLERVTRPIRTVGFGFDDDLGTVTASIVGTELRVGPHGSTFAVSRDGVRLGSIAVRQPGRYNAMNALAATATGLVLGVPFATIAAGLMGYSGIENRFTVVDVATRVGSVRVVKDYISHPTGIRRVLAAAKTLSDGPIIAIFKPYRFTMIHYLGDEYAVAFHDASHTVVTELYTAGEVPIAGVDAPWLVDKIRAAGSEVTFVPEMEDLPAWLEARLEAGQQLLFFGGDDLFRLADRFIARVGGSRPTTLTS